MVLFVYLDCYHQDLPLLAPSFPTRHSSDRRCVVMRGAGEIFLAGGEIKAMHQVNRTMTPEERYKMRLHGMHYTDYRIEALRRMRKPVIASVHRSEEHTSALQSLMRTTYAAFCLKKKKTKRIYDSQHI